MLIRASRKLAPELSRDYKS